MTTIFETIVTELESIQVDGSARFKVYKTIFDQSIAKKTPAIFVFPAGYNERPNGLFKVDTHTLYTAELFNKGYVSSIDDILIAFESDIDRISNEINGNRTMSSLCFETKITAGTVSVVKVGKGYIGLRCPLQLDCLRIR